MYTTGVRGVRAYMYDAEICQTLEFFAPELWEASWVWAPAYMAFLLGSVEMLKTQRSFDPIPTVRADTKAGLTFDVDSNHLIYMCYRV